MAGQQGPMPPIPPQQNQQGMIYDAPNCDYDPPSYMDQNFGNPYDCPEGNFFTIRYPAIIPCPANDYFLIFHSKLGWSFDKKENFLY